MFHLRPAAECGACGRRVRLRGYRAIVVVSGATGALVLAGYLFEVYGFGIVLLGMLLMLGADYWCWRAVPWDPVGPPADAAPADAIPAADESNEIIAR